jgi:hypothetical protein
MNNLVPSMERDIEPHVRRVHGELGAPPPVAVCEHSAAMLALPSPPSPHTYAPPSPPYAHTLWWGAATIRAGHADTAHLHLLINIISGGSGRRSTGRGGSCAAGRQLQHMLRRRHNVGVAPRKASHEQQTAKPSSTTHHDRPDGVWPALPQPDAWGLKRKKDAPSEWYISEYLTRGACRPR